LTSGLALGGSKVAKKRRVLLKLSGESFGGGSLGVNPDVVSEIAKDIAAAAKDVEIAIVVGGGNFFRGAELSNRGMDRGRADYMGMLGTVMNALALQDFMEQAGASVRVQTAISMAQVAEPYLPLRAIRHLEKGRVVIFFHISQLTPLLHKELLKFTLTKCWLLRMALMPFTPRIQSAIQMLRS
jgi:uridylate kinase